MPRQSPAADKALGLALRALRQKRGLTQEELAVAAHITTQTYARIELAQSAPSWATVRAIIETLGVSLAELARAIDRAERAG